MSARNFASIFCFGLVVLLTASRSLASTPGYASGYGSGHDRAVGAMTAYQRTNELLFSVEDLSRAADDDRSRAEAVSSAASEFALIEERLGEAWSQLSAVNQLERQTQVSRADVYAGITADIAAIHVELQNLKKDFTRGLPTTTESTP